MDLAELTFEKAKAMEGTVFRVELPDGATVDLKFDEALPYESRQSRRRGAAPKRQPFSLYFLGPLTPVLPQSTYTFRSDALTLDQLFIVPIGQDATATEYEAVFT
jgi:hypothetical protein